MSGTFAPTVEQQAILAAYRAGGSLLIEAGAGTGKTTTLQLLADHDPGKVLYLAYNKATSAEAKRKFPRNVTVSTAHAFALRQLRTANSSMAAAVIERLNAARMPNSQMARQLGVLMPLDLGPDRRPLQPPAQIGLAKETLKRWCWSADDQIAARHVPPLEGVEPSVARAIAPHLVKLAERLWADATAPGGQYKTDHDYYLKLFQLMRGKWGYDTVLLDESQDSNGVVLAMLQHQQATGTRMVAVGDRFQTLYCQPVGTMVTVPTYAVDVPKPQRCSADHCLAKRDHSASGLCDVHEQERRAGAPLRRRVPSTSGVREVPIESLAVGDRVTTYYNSNIYRAGRPISDKMQFAYAGELVNVTTPDGLKSSYMPQHHCIVRFGSELHDKWLVYLMRRNGKYRIGRSRFTYGSQGHLCGLYQRMRSEDADAGWVLSLHDSAADVVLAEALIGNQFNIPGVRFRPTRDQGELLDVEEFWNRMPVNEEQAKACLEAHGRLLEFPFIEYGGVFPHMRTPFTLAAANLLDGMRVLPLSSVKTRRRDKARLGEMKSPIECWVPVTVSRTHYTGDMVCITVDEHHTYFGDGILTHNSWRGSVDAMDKLDLPTRLPLTQSFRFGPAVADEANLWLAALGTKTRISGTPSISSQVGPLHANPDAVLCRTNAATIGAVIEYQASGVPVALVGGGLEVRQLAAAAEELQTTGRTWHPDLLAFTSWGQVQDYVEHDGGSELATFVKLIDSYGAAGIMRAVDDCVSEDRAAVTVSTAHKAKGREWSRVKVGSDFPQPMPPDPAPEDLMMLAYVTVTRARHHLDAGSLAWIGQYLDLHNIPRPAPSGYTPTTPALSPVAAQPATPTAGDEETSKPVPGPLAFVQQPTTPPPAAGETAPSTPAVQAQPALFAGPEPLPPQPQVIVPVALTGKTLRVLTRWAAAANRPLDDAIGHALDMLADTLDQTT